MDCCNKVSIGDRRKFVKTVFHKGEFIKKIAVLTTLIATAMLLVGCLDYPYMEYQHSCWNADLCNRIVDIPEGFILNQGHAYDIVETENGCDIIFHFVSE